ncbi:hypothetical protein JQ614_45585, partial [Bradyrhizobium diazoefficiens]|nr:hypothetical protein [Bradyrhizobium diazoefficiens]MBR0924882.1 hypothetical protein [Bradyrhizobium diazoefficiens]
MSAARIIKAPPLSGGDRKYYAREIRKAEVTFATIPGVGPIGSSMLSMKAPPPETFR